MRYERDRWLERAEEERRLVAGEALARRLDEVMKMDMSGVELSIQQAVFEKQAGSELPYNEALKAVALEQPALFLTKARADLGQIAGGHSIYFHKVGDQLVDPYVIENGAVRYLDSPLDTRALPGVLSVDQEIAIRVAEKMRRPTKSGVTMSYGDALKLVASECPNLFRQCRQHTPTTRRYE